MASPTEITVTQLTRRIGLPDCPDIVDVRIDEDWALDLRLLPGGWRLPHDGLEDWAGDYAGRKVVVVCQAGKKLSQGVAALLRQDGIDAETLEGGFAAWAADSPAIREAKLPPRDARGRTVWVTRLRPKIDRISCPWLIRRFVDPRAAFLFVSADEVQRVAERLAATPFDIEDGFWSHRGEACTFDVMLEEFALNIAPLARLARIVRGADTDRLDLAPEAAGLLAASLGFSRMYRDDLEQLEHSMTLHDAFYRWCQDAMGEGHDWPPARSGGRGQ